MVARKLVATYDYTDEDGEVLYRKKRFSDKSFEFLHPEGTRWVSGLGDVRRVPYNLVNVVRCLKGTELIWYVEGEKDCDRLIAEGYTATTFGGARDWKEEWAQWFYGATIAIIPDNDGPGRSLAENVAGDVDPIVVDLRVIELPGLPEKGDISDWLDAGHNGSELYELYEQAKPWERPGTGQLARELLATPASEIAPEHVAWLWPKWLPARRLTLFGGKPDEGKSAVTYDLAGRFSTGSPLPDGYRPSAPINVAILSAEDDPNDTIVPRLIAAGANLERILIVDDVVDEAGLVRPWVLPDNIPELGALVVRERIDLVIIDTLSAYISTGVDTHKESPVRAMLKPLATMARSTDCSVLAIRHLRKGSTDDPRDAGTGSIAFTAAARMEWIVGRDPQDSGRHILATTKHNLSPDVPSLAYRLASAECEWDTVAVRWDGTSTVTARDLTAAMNDREHDQLDEAVTFLVELLADGPVKAREAEAGAKRAEIAKRTLRRAKDQLGIKSRKLPDGPWVWELPNQDVHEDVQGERHGRLGHLPWSEREEDVFSLLEGFIEGGQDVQDVRPVDGLDTFTDSDATELLLAAFPGAQEEI